MDDPFPLPGFVSGATTSISLVSRYDPQLQISGAPSGSLWITSLGHFLWFWQGKVDKPAETVLFFVCRVSIEDSSHRMAIPSNTTQIYANLMFDHFRSSCSLTKNEHTLECHGISIICEPQPTGPMLRSRLKTVRFSP